MPRTASTLVKAHGGSWELLFGPDVPADKQIKHFRELRGKPAHAEYSNLRFQEGEGGAITLNFRTPDAQNKHVADRKAEDEKAKKQSAILENAGKNAQRAFWKTQRDHLDKNVSEMNAKLKADQDAAAAGQDAGRPAQQQQQQQQQQPLRNDGPTFEQWVADGREPEKYPPAGYTDSRIPQSPKPEGDNPFGEGQQPPQNP